MKPGKGNVFLWIRYMSLIAAALLIIDSVTVILIVPLNFGSVLPGILGIIIIAAVIFRRRIALLPRTKAGRVAAWLVGVIVGANIMLFIIFIALTLTQSGAESGYEPDAVVILGAGLNRDRVSIALAARLNTAILYYQRHPGVIMVASGGQGPNETVTEASAMAKYLEARGVPAKDIIQEARSSNTEENFAFSKDILAGVFGDRHFKILYVTNQFHVYRAGLYAKKASLTAEGLAAPTLPRYLAPNFYAREYFALIKYWLFRR